MLTQEIRKKLNFAIPQLKIFENMDFLDNILEDKVRTGLDIGSHAVKLVQVQKVPSGHSLVALGYKEIQQSANSKNPEQSQEAIIQAINSLWQEHKVRDRKVRLVISDKAVYTRHIQIPKVGDEEIAKAIKWQAEKYTPFNVENCIVDYQLTDQDSLKGQGQIEVVIVAVEKKVIDQYLSILKSCRLSPVVIDFSAFAMAKAFLRSFPLDNNEFVPIIDIGAQSTAIVIARNNSLRLVRILDIGGNQLTQAIAAGLNVDRKEAERIKKEGSIDPADAVNEKQPEIFPLIEPILKELLTQVNRSLAYCEKELTQDKISRIYLCGGTANLKGLDKFLTHKLNLPIEKAMCFKKSMIERSKFDSAVLEKISPQLMAAFGEVL